MKDTELFNKTRQIIPWATQTNAKRPKQFMQDTMPLFFDKGKGIRLIDNHGNAYEDYFCSCGPIILGYAYDKVNDAAKAAIDDGVVFSMASTLEYQLAERFLNIIPSLEWIRFLKTGNDATSAAVRIARAYKGKEKILQCGYHGWSDWFQTATGARKEQGVPDYNANYTIPFQYNDIDFIENTLKNDSNIAGVILTPYDWKTEPKDNFLHRLRDICTKYDVPLIFDEVLTGFRMGLLGAQGEFGVEADIVCYAKAISNGFPLSAIGGKKKFGEVWDNDKTMITTTYAGEIVSIAASIATLDEFTEKDVFAHIKDVGSYMYQGLDEIIKKTGLPLYYTGRHGLTRLFADTKDNSLNYDIQCKISRHYMSEGFFVREHGGVSYYLNYSHKEKDISKLLAVTEKAFLAGFDR